MVLPLTLVTERTAPRPYPPGPLPRHRPTPPGGAPGCPEPVPLAVVAAATLPLVAAATAGELPLSVMAKAVALPAVRPPTITIATNPRFVFLAMSMILSFHRLSVHQSMCCLVPGFAHPAEGRVGTRHLGVSPPPPVHCYLLDIAAGCRLQGVCECLCH